MTVLPDYLSHWGFQKSPFSLSPDPEMLFLTSQHQEALLRLKYGVLSNKGGMLLVSENAGDGKTSLLRRLMQDLRAEYPAHVKIAFIDHPTLTVNQMIAEIARQLGVARVRKEKVDNLNSLRAHLGTLHAGGIKALVVVDEGQMLAHSPEILQELRILLNFCVSDAFLLSFVFSGQKPLEDAIKRMPEFWQRLPVRFFLKNLDLRDTADLIRHRVRVAGQQERDIFTPTAVEGIWRASQGCPRVICSLADLSLLIGHSLSSQKVDFREVSQATSDMSRSGEVFHYLSFLGAEKAKRATPRRCASCHKFVKATEADCPRCGTAVAAAAAPAPRVAREREERVPCPACQQPTLPTGRCACGFVLSQSCPRCQHRNPADLPACHRCGCRLAGREALACRELEDGLRRLGLSAHVVPADYRRFPFLQAEGRIYWSLAAPRLAFWRPRPRLSGRDGSLEGSFFVTERALLFAHGGRNRRIGYEDIRAMSVTTGERRGAYAVPQLRIQVDGEELRVELPVATDRPAQLASLLSEFVANKRYIVPLRLPLAAAAVVTSARGQ